MIFVAPALVLYAAFVLWPLASSVYYSMTDWDGIAQARWIGFANFERAFADKIHLASYLHVTLYILGTLVFEVSFGLFMAVLLAVTGGFAGFDLFFTMTNGQPYNSTEVPATWIMKQAFDNDQLGYGIALIVILTGVVCLISLVYLRYAERRHARRLVRDPGGAGFGEGIERIRHFLKRVSTLFDDLTEIGNRDLFYTFQPYLWECRFPHEDRLPNTYRQGLAVALQHLFPRDETGVYRHAT